MKVVKFSEYKSEITKTIHEKLQLSPIPNENGFTLIEGFIMQPLSNEISGSFVLGGPTIPLVAVVGNTSGRIYYFALKALIPDIGV